MIEENCDANKHNGSGRCRRSDEIDGLGIEISSERENRRAGELQILEGLGVLTREVAILSNRVGKPPNPIEDFEGTGLQRAVFRVTNESIKRRLRSLPISSEEESEITKVQDRSTLLARTRLAEYEQIKSRQRMMLAIIGGVITTVTTIGTVLVAWLTGG